jgi:ligand-binding sensor domain-containing protein/two-component sensor histidine kinase
VLLILQSPFCYAQPALNKIQFNHFSAEHGISQATAMSIFQDSKGYMWFGGFTGLVKFDGYKLTTFNYDPNKKNSLPNNDVYKFCEDRNGNIWMGSGADQIVSKYSPQTGNFTAYHLDGDKSTGLSGYVSDLVTDRQGKMWIGTDAGLGFYDKHSDKIINLSNIISPDTLCDRQVHCLMIDHNGFLWIGTSNGINIYDPVHKKIKLFNPPDKNYAVLGKQIQCMLEDHNGDIWISVWWTSPGIRGIYRYNPSTGTSEIYHHSATDPNSLSAGAVNTLLEDSHHTIWACMFERGLNAYQPATDNFIHYRADATDHYALNSDQIVSLFEDRSGVLWIGTDGGGLNTCYLSNKNFTVYQNYNKQFISHYPMSLYKDHSGKIYMSALSAGIYEFNPATGNFKSYKFSMPNDEITGFNSCYGMLEGSDGNLWLVTYDEGLHKLDRKTGRFTTVHSTSDNADTTFHNISNCIVEDLNKRLWIGTNNGLKCYDLKTKTFSGFENLYRDTNQLSNDGIVYLYCDPEGILWIAGTNGLTLFDTKTGQVKIFRHDSNNPHSISTNRLNYFLDDGSGNVWIGTEGGGLNGFNKKTGQFVSYTTKDGLPDNSIYGILKDDQGNLWLSTYKGICRFTPPTFSNSKAVCRTYDMSDGLPGNESFLTTCVKGNDGTLYFAPIGGLVAFKPGNLKDNSFVPPVVITDFSVFNKSILPNDSTGILKLPVDETKEIKLSYKQNNFSFTFAALSYVHPEKNQYLYKLENYDKDWIHTDASKRFAGYTNLDAGEYIFKVKGTNNDGVWNEEGASIKLIITPPYWQTWWFRSLCIFTGLLIVFAILYARLQKMRDILRIRNRIASDLHDDLGATLSSISIMSELVHQQIKDQSPQASSLLEKIGSSSRNMIESVNDMVWAINPKNDSFENVIKRMRTFASEILGAKDIAFHFDFDKNLLQSKLKMDTRRNFYLIFKEAVNNIAKYSYAANASVMIWNKENNMKMTIRDDGNGFDLGSVLRGNGLTNMQQRAGLMKAKFNLESTPGKGTIVELEFKNE